MFTPSLLACLLMLSLFRSCLGKPCCWMSRVKLSCHLEMTHSHRTCPGLWLLQSVYYTFLQCSLSLGVRSCAVDGSIEAGHPIISCSLHFDQLRFAVLIHLFKNKASFMRGGTMLISGYKNKYLVCS